jgi:hypothetical protein
MGTSLVSKATKSNRAAVVAVGVLVAIFVGWIALELLAPRSSAICHFLGGEITSVAGAQTCSHHMATP